MATVDLGKTFNVKDLKAALMGSVQTKVNNKESSRQTDVMQNMSGLLQRVAKNTEEEISNAHAEINATRQMMKSMNQINSRSREESHTEKEHSSYLKDIAHSTKNLWTASQSKHTLWVAIAKFDAVAKRQLTEAICDCLGGRRGGKGGGSGAGGGGSAGRNYGGGGGGGPLSVVQGVGDSLKGLAGSVPLIGGLFAGVIGMVQGGIEGIAGLLSGIGVDLNFKVALADSAALYQNIRDITFQQKVGAMEQESMLKNFNQGMEESTATLNQTGMTFNEFQTRYLNNVRTGFDMQSLSDLKHAKSLHDQNRIYDDQLRRIKTITKTALNTAYQLGANADEVSSLFNNWRVQLSMSRFELAQMGEHMMEIARSTGLTGDHLVAALKGAGGVMKELQKSGTLTEQSAKNATALSAAAEKYGVSGKAQELMAAMTGLEGFLNASGQTQVLLSKVAAASGIQQRDMMSGVAFNDPKMMDNLIKGLGTVIPEGVKKSIGAKTGFDISKDMSLLGPAMQKLTEMGDSGTLQQLQMLTKRGFGIDPGDLSQLTKALAEASQANIPIQQKIADLQLKAQMAGTDEQRSMLEKQISQLRGQDQISVLNSLAKNLEFVGRDGVKMTGELSRQINDLSGRIDPKTLMEGLTSSAPKGFDVEKNLVAEFRNQGLKVSTVDEAMGVLKSGSTEQVKSGVDAINSIRQQMQAAQKRAEDPILDIQHSVKQIQSILETGLYNVLGQLLKWAQDLGLKDALKWVSEKIQEGFKWIEANFPAVREWIEGTVKWLWDGIVSFWTKWSPTFESIWASIQSGFTTAVEWLTSMGETLSGIWESITYVASAIWELASPILNSIWTAISDVASGIWSAVSPILTGIGETLMFIGDNILMPILSTIASIMQTGWNLVMPPISGTWEILKGISEMIGGWIGTAGKAIKRTGEFVGGAIETGKNIAAAPFRAASSAWNWMTGASNPETQLAEASASTASGATVSGVNTGAFGGGATETAMMPTAQVQAPVTEKAMQMVRTVGGPGGVGGAGGPGGKGAAAEALKEMMEEKIQEAAKMMESGVFGGKTVSEALTQTLFGKAGTDGASASPTNSGAFGNNETTASASPTNSGAFGNDETAAIMQAMGIKPEQIEQLKKITSAGTTGASAGNVAHNYMDYREQTKGIASTAHNPLAAQDRVMLAHGGFSKGSDGADGQGANLGQLVSIEGKQTSVMQEVAKHLAAILALMQTDRGTTVIGAGGVNLPPPFRTTLRNYSNDFVRGKWDSFQESDSMTGNVPHNGNGGALT